MSNLIENYRKKSYDLLIYEALLRRLKGDLWFNEKIIAGYKKEKAGYDGESAVDYTISTFRRNDFVILRGLRLKNPPFYFQIDTLILTKKFICILEIKNYKGIFSYDSKQHQLTQKVNGRINSYKDPILQAEAQKNHLKTWLVHRGFFNIPIETLVVVAYPSTIVENVHQDTTVYNKIIHTASLQLQIERLNNLYSKDSLTMPTVQEIGRQLQQADEPLRTNILQQLGLAEHHFIDGILCTKCNKSPMKRLYKKWLCSGCKNTDTKAHEQVIYDYFLIHGDTITNSQCQQILKIKSPRTPYTLLTGMELRQSGNNRTRKYHAPASQGYPQKSYIPANRLMRLQQEYSI